MRITDSTGSLGRYRFNTYVRAGIILRTAETRTINIKLVLGALSEAITVSATLSAVETKTKWFATYWC